MRLFKEILDLIIKVSVAIIVAFIAGSILALLFATIQDPGIWHNL